ncbi:MAG TPA: hypothetical protein VIP46_16015 [Pyrinomonadaceae bacterium]
MPIPFDPSFVLDLADKLGIIQAVKGKLLRQPDEAADKLVIVLDELSKVFTTIEAELVRYLSLNFDPEENLADERETLLTLEGGQLAARVGEARGHCHKIDNIYHKHLQRWFHSVLNPGEAQLVEDVFIDLSNADGGFIRVLDELADWLTTQATETLDLVDSQQFDAANQRVRAARKEVLPVRRSIAKAQTDLRNLQAEFIQASGTA